MGVIYTASTSIFIALTFFCQWPEMLCQFLLHNADPKMNSYLLYYDCLHYRKETTKVAYQHLSDMADHLIPYCIRPENSDYRDQSIFADEHGFRRSFEQLLFENVTVMQLFDWSVPVDVIERYQRYMDSTSDRLNEYYYNCTKSRFGHKCQYSFGLDQSESFEGIVDYDFAGRQPYFDPIAMANTMIHFPCYVLLQCDRGGPSLCLDWREICNGVVDCLDGGRDEEFCFEMEMNECETGEYRCHNGLCIPGDLWQDQSGDLDCLDRSDGPSSSYSTSTCYQDPTFQCEEHSCKYMGSTLPCGDGHCVMKFMECSNGRDAMLRQSLIMRANLSEKCWMAMACLTTLVIEVNEIACKILLDEDRIEGYLQECESIYQFPSLPLYSDHVRLVYKRPQSISRTATFLLPDYACYDPQLCSFSSAVLLFNGTQTCLPISAIQVPGFPDTLGYINIAIERSFRSCFTRHADLDNQVKYGDRASLYTCHESSKMISKHRLLDLEKDCVFGDDETYNNSCALGDPFRRKCYDETNCMSPVILPRECIFNELSHGPKVPFNFICDGIENSGYDIDPVTNAPIDEFNCKFWPCDNLYTRCDGFWTCSDGKDESDCDISLCPANMHPCVSPSNYSFFCLDGNRVNDDNNDCLGASDQRLQCGNFMDYKIGGPYFGCADKMTCLFSSKLCDGAVDCPDGDDEAFCNGRRFVCREDRRKNRTLVEQLLCGLGEQQEKSAPYESIRTSSDFPSSDHSHDEMIDQNALNMVASKEDILETETQTRFNPWPWYCNRGIQIYQTIQSESHPVKSCFCPPSYYGNLCQYQNQRVSLTLQISSSHRVEIYRIVSLLIDDNDDEKLIESYDQYLDIAQQRCSVKINRYLLFSERPKNISKNYGVHVHVISMRDMKHIGSWHYSIPFLFLPVNRVVGQIIIPAKSSPDASQCPSACEHGRCLKYMNKEKYFCYCASGWTGVRCDQKVSDHSQVPFCSETSMTMGSIKNTNRSLCICPLNRFGEACLYDTQCPVNLCQNHGQCITTDLSRSEKKYMCLCPDLYYGQYCQYLKSTVDMMIDDIRIPSYISAYFFTLSNHSRARTTHVLKKLTLFQRLVSFHVAVPYHIILLRISDRFYLNALQKRPKYHLKTSINSKHECRFVGNYLNPTLMELKFYDRIKYYHLVCQQFVSLQCFLDEIHLCLCTDERHANCFSFDANPNYLHCSLGGTCLNDGQCLQDHPRCPSARICVCQSCFFGDQCQYYAKGLGATLDEILGYEIQFDTDLFRQPFSVLLSFFLTILMFFIGSISSLCSIITFSSKRSREVGTGIYLWASSLTSLLIMILFTLKFLLLFVVYQDIDGKSVIRTINCFAVESLIKLLIYTDHWYNACVAIERSLSVYKGIHFNRKRSIYFAKLVIILIPSGLLLLFLPQFLHLQVFYDEKEQRSWCVISYHYWLHIHGQIQIFFHYFTPLLMNFLSAIYIIIATTRQRSLTHPQKSFFRHLKSRLTSYRHLLISPALIILLTLPHLIISIVLDCHKSSYLFWFYFNGYFLSFAPAMCVFLIFVMPSAFYKQEFRSKYRRFKRKFRAFLRDFFPAF